MRQFIAITIVASVLISPATSLSAVELEKKDAGQVAALKNESAPWVERTATIGIFSLLGIGALFTLWFVMRGANQGEPGRTRDMDNQASRRRVVKKWGHDEFDIQPTARVSRPVRNKARVPAAPASNLQRQSVDDNRQRNSDNIGTALTLGAFAVLAMSSSGPSSGSDCSGGAGDTSGGGAE